MKRGNKVFQAPPILHFPEEVSCPPARTIWEQVIPEVQSKRKTILSDRNVNKHFWNIAGRANMPVFNSSLLKTVAHIVNKISCCKENSCQQLERLSGCGEMVCSKALIWSASKPKTCCQISKMCVSILRFFSDKNVKRNTIVGVFDLKNQSRIIYGHIPYCSATSYYFTLTRWPHSANHRWETWNFNPINKYENIKYILINTFLYIHMPMCVRAHID